ncbi:CaiB/BaiF CoA transferase family protein [Ottowia sp. VDI28]|uniref:CaiB/BaiF CoA transferase family protein n=1 Tax=Ottowia sp. VDI28 TaxID=3133968 RepID=UPI003C2B90A7
MPSGHEPDGLTLMTHQAEDKPLRGLRVLELEALGPVPWACMVLADLGADIVRIENPASLGAADTYGSVLRGRTRVSLDLKREQDRQVFLRLAEKADVLVEGMRPGAMERLGLGPAEIFQANEKLIFARMTGWGQDGPLANEAGHDINYIAVAGILNAIGPAEKPAIPLNLIGDFAGGSCFLLIGLLAALFQPRSERQRVLIDAAMVDGASVLMSLIYSRRHMGQWCDERASNALDGGRPWYDTYRTKDGRRVAVGALEPKFYANLIATLGLSDLPSREDKSHWQAIRRAFEDTFATRTREEWAEIFQGVDACVSPVLEMAEAISSPQLSMHGTFSQRDGEFVPAPAPVFKGCRFSLAPSAVFAQATEVIAGWDAR